MSHHEDFIAISFANCIKCNQRGVQCISPGHTDYWMCASCVEDAIEDEAEKAGCERTYGLEEKYDTDA